jgi:type IV conjugative transfer system protein TraL
MDDHDMKIVMGLKDPWKFLFVDMDVAMVAGAVGCVALNAGYSPTVVVIAAGVTGYLMHAARKGKPKGFARHFIYWHLPPTVSGLKRVPPAWATRTVG